MKKDLLLWNDDIDRVWGKVSDFNNQEKFVNIVKEYYKEVDGVDCFVENVEVHPCISIDKDADIEILTYYYMADVGVDD